MKVYVCIYHDVGDTYYPPSSVVEKVFAEKFKAKEWIAEMEAKDWRWREYVEMEVE